MYLSVGRRLCLATSLVKTSSPRPPCKAVLKADTSEVIAKAGEIRSGHDNAGTTESQPPTDHHRGGCPFLLSLVPHPPMIEAVKGVMLIILMMEMIADKYISLYYCRV